MFNTEKEPQSSYQGYFSLVNSGLQEPASQHSDHFSTNRAYSTAAYSMGAVFLNQLKYLVGEENFYVGMRRYYATWKMRHPEPNDFLRVMEKVSGLTEVEFVLEIPFVKLRSVPGIESMVAKFTTDIPALTNWGTPVLLGPGSIHVAHTEREYISKKQLHQAVDLYCSVAHQLLETS